MSDRPSTPKTIFLNALEIPSAEARRAYIAAQCGADESLGAEVAELLRHHQELGNFLEPAPADRAVTVDLPPSMESAGTIIGPYKLLEQIGEGGMGTVFMAEQTEPVKRRVALKIVKPGMDSRQVIARFAAEKQALALMDHVNIARVLDAGATEQGRPYFVMELVHGVPITKYCDDNHFTPRQRLELFVPVCQAIQHAHQKGIIHRDIKPSNVMVTLYDGKPVPKVIDFGVAKATEQKLTERTLFTQYGTMVGTLEYMSPEQAEMSALGVDTRSDIYSLGVLLYELLTGSTPLSSRRVKEAAYGEILRLIKEEEPPKPSTRLSESGEALASISALRQTEPAKLSKLMRGELDWIVMKTLEKDRNRRYETANSFAADVQRYLNDEPVEAHPPSAAYRLRKFVRRRKGTILVASLLIVALLVGVGTLAVSNRIISRERDEAQRQRQFARRAVDKMITDVAEKWLAHQTSLEPLQREFLSDALAFYEERVRDEGANAEERLEAGNAYRRMGQIHHKLGDPVKAEQSFQNAVALLTALVAQSPADVRYRVALATCLYQYGDMLQVNDTQARGHEMLAQAARQWESLVEEFPTNPEYRLALARSLARLADTSRWLGWFAEAEKAYRKSLALLAMLPAEIAGMAEMRYQLGTMKIEFSYLLGLLYRAEESEPLFAEGKSILTGLVAEAPQEALYRNELAWTTVSEAMRFGWSRPQEAELMTKEALTTEEKLAAEAPGVPDYQYVIAVCNGNLATLYENAGRLKEAEGVVRRAIEILQRLVADFPALRPFVYNNGLISNRCQLARLLRATGREIEAEQEFRKAFTSRLKFDALAGPFRTRPEHRKLLAHHFRQLAVMLDTSELDSEREQLFRDAIKLLADAAPALPNSADAYFLLGETHGLLAGFLLQRSRPQEAEENYRIEIDTFEKLPLAFLSEVPSRQALVQTAYTNLASLLKGPPSRTSEWVQLAQRAVKRFPQEAKFCHMLGTAHYSAGSFQLAVEALNQSLALQGENASDEFFLSMTYARLDQKDESRRWFAKAVAWMDQHAKDKPELIQLRKEAAGLAEIKEGAAEQPPAAVPVPTADGNPADDG